MAILFSFGPLYNSVGKGHRIRQGLSKRETEEWPLGLPTVGAVTAEVLAR